MLQKFKILVILFVFCNNSVVFCDHCEPLVDNSYHSVCFSENDNEPFSCSDPSLLRSGVTARIQCRYGFEKLVDSDDTLKCKNGFWNPSPTKCVPVCGLDDNNKSGHSDPVPWHATIFSNRLNNSQQVTHCSGTILTSKIIISAAHCFWDDTIKSYIKVTDFTVVVGTVNSTQMANESQRLNINKIIPNPFYTDEAGFYESDIIAIVLNTSIVFKPHVRPICLHQSNQRYITDLLVTPGVIGRIGFDDPLTNQIGSVEVKIVDHNNCKRDAQKYIKTFITTDKSCVCSLNGGQGIPVENSGGGLVIPRRVYGAIRYFFGGVVSASTKDKKIILITNLESHMNFIFNVKSQIGEDYKNI